MIQLDQMKMTEKNTGNNWMKFTHFVPGQFKTQKSKSHHPHGRIKPLNEVSVMDTSEVEILRVETSIFNASCCREWIH